MKNYLFVFSLTVLLSACGVTVIDPARLEGTWHLKEIDSGSGRAPADAYNIHRFFPNHTLRILDAEQTPFVIEDDTIFIIARPGEKRAFEKIISISDAGIVLCDTGDTKTKMFFENISFYDTAIIGTWRLDHVLRDGEVIPPEAINLSRDLVRIFNADGSYMEIKDGKKSGPFPYTINGLFAEIQLGQGKTDYFQIHRLTGTVLERNIVPHKPALRTVYKKVVNG